MLRTRLLPYIAIASAVSAAAIPQTVSAHGYMDYPPARQEICDSDGGFWDSADGSTIPNTACRAAFWESSWIPFIQKHEFAKLVSDYTNQAAVEEGIPSGALCSGGDPDKAGIDLPSSEWQTTPIDPAANGKLTLLYHADTPHNPSFWKIYLSNANYNPASSPLAWSDIDLIAEFDDLPVVVINERKYYQMQVTLPTDRTGNAVLFSRWQRVDAAGEGFYNCSDISFGGDVVAPTWNSIGSAIKSTTDASAGDTVWFRVFDGSGAETVFEKLPIDATNDAETVWGAQLANAVNNTSSSARLGKLAEDGTVAWDSNDLYGNLVFVKNTNHSFQLEVKKAAVNAAPVLSAPTSVSVDSGQDVQFSVSATDADNDPIDFSISEGSFSIKGNTATVTYSAPDTLQDLIQQVQITATDGQATVSTVVDIAVKGTGPVGETDWRADNVYLAGDSVNHLGTQYTAQWWTKGDEPGTSSVWQAQAGGSVQTWNDGVAYSAGDIVMFENASYEAKWWTKGDLPSNGGPWKRVK
ncbi:lytic polysaccharide monooxygenase [Enterovibrio baiacu]|uniref:lytic polysaccharide monooxygenase n=1 Tax=Enterovibrio baiacu TaxID=2491023 RepID=UPI003D12FCA4